MQEVYIRFGIPRTRFRKFRENIMFICTNKRLCLRDIFMSEDIYDIKVSDVSLMCTISTWFEHIVANGLGIKRFLKENALQE